MSKNKRTTLTGKTNKVATQGETIFTEKMHRPKPWPKPSSSQRPQALSGITDIPKPKSGAKPASNSKRLSEKG